MAYDWAGQGCGELEIGPAAVHQAVAWLLGP